MTQRISRPSGLQASTPILTRNLIIDSFIYYDKKNDISQGPMFLPQCEDQVDPDRIQLPGSGAHNLNTLEEFELDYSQVGSWEGQEEFLFSK